MTTDAEKTSPFETLVDEPLDKEHRYVLEAVAGMQRNPQSPTITEMWAHIRRRIERISDNETLWIRGVHVTSTTPSNDMLCRWMHEEHEKAEKRIRTIREQGLSSYLQRNKSGPGDYEGPMPLEQTVKNSTEVFRIREILEAAENADETEAEVEESATVASSLS